MFSFRGPPVAVRVTGLVTACVLLMDLVSKAVAESRLHSGRHYWLIDGVVGLQRTTNRGVAFGLGGDSPFVTVGVVVALVALGLAVIQSGVMRQPGGPLAIGAIAGGGIGNLVDRLADGSVTDFLVVGPWPRFNIADTALTCGILAVVLIEFRHRPGYRA